MAKRESNFAWRSFAVTLVIAGVTLFTSCSGSDTTQPSNRQQVPATGSPASTAGQSSTPANANASGSPTPAPSPSPAKAEQGKTITTASGLKYIDLTMGTGPSPSRGRQVTVHYTGTFENGKKFDSSLDAGRPFTFIIGAGQVIRGWDEGVMTMKVGGKRKLICPPDLAYGARGYPPTIPPNATLIFEVELLAVR